MRPGIVEVGPASSRRAIASEHRRTSRSFIMKSACGATVVGIRWPLETLGSAKSNAWKTS